MQCVEARSIRVSVNSARASRRQTQATNPLPRSAFNDYDKLRLVARPILGSSRLDVAITQSTSSIRSNHHTAPLYPALQPPWWASVAPGPSLERLFASRCSLPLTRELGNQSATIQTIEAMTLARRIAVPRAPTRATGQSTVALTSWGVAIRASSLTSASTMKSTTRPPSTVFEPAPYGAATGTISRRPMPEKPLPK